MLYLNTGTTPSRAVEPHEPADAVWLDLLNATEAERAAAERATGLIVPAEVDLAEIESSSRLSREGNVLTLSTPMSHPGPAGNGVDPLGFVLSPEHLLTVRIADIPVFAQFAERFSAASGPKRSADAFIGLTETIVDRLADVLEQVGAQLGTISRKVFAPPAPRRGRLAKVGVELQGTLRAVGMAGERVSNIRDSLLGMQRLTLYVHDAAADWFPPELRPRLLTIRQDLASLTDYESQLTNKVQFLLDATLGFINIEQNNGINVLTVVSVVGVPPTLIAGIYGMNFKNIPEYDWSYGYQWGLGLMVVSAVLPLIWFKRRGWI